jgi:hypothetical protein
MLGGSANDLKPFEKSTTHTPSLLLPYNFEHPAIITTCHNPTLLLFHVKDIPAIMTRTQVNFKLQLIVASNQGALTVQNIFEDTPLLSFSKGAQ